MTLSNARETRLVRTLADDTQFKPNGLVKKMNTRYLQTCRKISDNLRRQCQSPSMDTFSHLVSYYSINDVTNGALKPPSSFTELALSGISPEF